MIYVLFVFGVALVAVTGRLIVHAVAVPKLQASVRLREVGRYGYDPTPAEELVGSRVRLNARINLVAENVGRFAMINVTALDPIARGDLTAAGFYTVSAEAVHGYRILVTLACPGLVFFYAVTNGSFSLPILGLLVAAGAGGWLLPALAIRRRGSARLAKIDRELPELIDLLIATVEAGMGFGGSMSLVSGRFQGPLGDELRLTLRAQSLGMSNTQALEDMLERCDTPSMRTFVRTVTRGESLGVSIGPILRELATDQRRRRRQAAEQKMQKAPVKMLFPLIVLIFPALMIELLFPAAYSLMKSFSGG